MDVNFGMSRNEVYAKPEQNGIKARKYFHPLTNAFDCYHGEFDQDLTPVARYVSKRVLTLPMYTELTLQDVDWICDVILECKQ